jgi:DNA-binding transcriptional LysR family regulator
VAFVNLDSFKAFCLVVEHGSISQAARHLFISQPAVTRQIRALEDYYGVSLFDRSGGRLQVTEAGQRLYPYIKAILEDHHRAKEALSELMGEYRNHVSIGATLTIGEYLLPGLLKSLKQHHPDLKLTIQIDNTQHILESLTEHAIDLALVEGRVDDDTFLVEPFAQDELILICPKGHPWAKREFITTDELIEERIILREPGSGTRMIVENVLEQKGILDKINSYMEIGSTQAIKGLVESGLGVAFLSKMSVIREINLNLVKEVKVDGLTMRRSLWLVQIPRRFPRPGVKQLIQFIQRETKLLPSTD